MILNMYLKFAFVSVPKCATNTLYAYLLQLYHGSTRYGSGYHNTKGVPNVPEHYHIFSVKRNPYSRIVSWWASTTQREGDQYGIRAQCKAAGHNPDVFHDWLAWVVDARPELIQPVTPYIGAVYDRIHTWLRVENLWEDFNRLPFVEQPAPPMPDLNPTHGVNRKDDWQEYFLDAETFRLVNEWAGDDFRLFGYSKIGA